jgi:hypothetical protein
MGNNHAKQHLVLLRMEVRGKFFPGMPELAVPAKKSIVEDSNSSEVAVNFDPLAAGDTSRCHTGT